MRRSLAFRLLLGTSIAAAVMLGLLGISIFVAMRRSLLSEFDSALATKASAVAAMAEQDGKRVIFESDYLGMDEFTKSQTPEFFEARLGDGRILATSPTLKSRTLAPAMNLTVPEYRNLVLPDGRSGRAITIRFVPRFEAEPGTLMSPAPIRMQEAVLILARDLGPFEATLSRLRLLLLTLCALAIALSGVMLLAIVARTTRPIRKLAREIESLGEGDLHSRLAMRDVPSELLPVVDRLNGLLGRLQLAFEREKSFTADVAHELRTPLSGLTTTLQVCRSRPRSEAEYEAAIDRCLQISGGMRTTVQSLLLLARADAGQLLVESRPIALANLVGECWVTCQSRAADRGLRADIVVADDSFIESDPAKIRIIISNLFDNAVSYADKNSVVCVQAEKTETDVSLRMSNAASGFRADDVAWLFHRFWRGDAARQAGVHCGLGLSICSRLVNLLGGRIAASVDGGVFAIVLTFPLKSAEIRSAP